MESIKLESVNSRAAKNSLALIDAKFGTFYSSCQVYLSAGERRAIKTGVIIKNKPKGTHVFALSEYHFCFDEDNQREYADFFVRSGMVHPNDEEIEVEVTAIADTTIAIGDPICNFVIVRPGSNTEIISEK